MRKLLALAVASVVVAYCADTPLLACGDKFLLIGRALKYQQAYASPHPGTIVIFDAPGSRVGTIARELKLQQLLTAAGHTVQTVSTVAELERVVKSAPPDIVLADSTDSVQLEASVQRTTAIIPIVVLQTGGKSRHPLSVIDDALKVKARRAAVKS
jgi:hypothetical protein